MDAIASLGKHGNPFDLAGRVDQTSADVRSDPLFDCGGAGCGHGADGRARRACSSRATDGENARWEANGFPAWNQLGKDGKRS